jgi:hypothetical protein
VLDYKEIVRKADKIAIVSIAIAEFGEELQAPPGPAPSQAHTQFRVVAAVLVRVTEICIIGVVVVSDALHEYTTLPPATNKSG